MQTGKQRPLERLHLLHRKIGGSDMETKVMERTVTQIYTVYEAIDGTVFDNEKECAEYDKSCEAIVRARFLAFSKEMDKDSPAWAAAYSLLYPLAEYYPIAFYISEPRTEEDCNTIARFIYTFGDHTDIARTEPCPYCPLYLCELVPGKRYLVVLDEEWGGVYEEEKLKSKTLERIDRAFHGSIHKEESKN